MAISLAHIILADIPLTNINILSYDVFQVLDPTKAPGIDYQSSDLQEPCWLPHKSSSPSFFFEP